jgi:WhiB family redox-sensing transcriptional regulator
MANNPYATQTYTDEPNWRESAACLDMDVNIFDVKPNTPKASKAREICDSCPVRFQCLQWTLTLDETEDHLMLGGLTEQERRKLRKEIAA